MVNAIGGGTRSVSVTQKQFNKLIIVFLWYVPKRIDRTMDIISCQANNTQIHPNDLSFSLQFLLPKSLVFLIRIKILITCLTLAVSCMIRNRMFIETILIHFVTDKQ